MRIRRSHRILAVLLIKLFLWDICHPTMVWALTGGPSQPEFESFEPVSTDQMVDLFTGDFNYNIPLLTVPGPNGGYPINLAYHAGIGIEQEASWVGLGWNINAGVVNRMVRGLPDDFDGDQIVKKTNMRPDETYGLAFSADPSGTVEVFGLDFELGAAKAMLYANSYRGVGIRLDAGLSGLVNEATSTSDKNNALRPGLQFSFDSQTGLGISPSLSYSHQDQKTYASAHLSASLHSRYGLQQMDLGADKKIDVAKTWNPSGGSGFSFSSPSYLPAPFAQTTGLNTKLGVSWGPATTASHAQSFTAEGLFSKQYIAPGDREQRLPGFGYMYSEDRWNAANGLMDLNRDKDVAVTRHIPNVPMPVFTYDPFVIKGQGTSGFFRPFRSDIGLLFTESRENVSHGADVTVEIGPPTGSNWKVGADVGYLYSAGYGGRWRDGLSSIDGTAPYLSWLLPQTNSVDLRFQPKSTDDPLYEPFYMKAAGEKASVPLDQWDHLNGEEPVKFELATAFEWESGDIPTVNAKPRVRNNIGNDAPGIPSAKNKRQHREKRIQSIEYRTMGEIRHDQHFTQRPDVLFNANPGLSGGTQLAYADYMRDHHIGEITVRNPDGTTYVYGLPAYNKTQKEVSFAVEDPEGTTASGYGNAAVIDWPSGLEPEDLEDNTNGQDHHYSATEIPPYAHSYLLTAVYSPDYVDVDDNGASENDLGYYVKFNYSESGHETKWRTPYRGVNYAKGFYSNEKDDKASYAFGTKQEYYLHSIETKTHFARFIVSERSDGYGAVGENGDGTPGSTQAPKKLDRIELYSKNASTTPLKQVLFTYEDEADELCQGAENKGSSGGKLTLHSVQFRHMNSSKGELTPYVFTYDQSVSGGNPEYSRFATDRWGNYQPYAPANPNTDNPYVDQTEIISTAERNARAAAWCLRSLQLPSGGHITVDYEADDYAYVQNRAAMNMFRIVGTSEAGTNTTPDDEESGSLKKTFRRIYIDLGRTLASAEAVQDTMARALKGVEDLYFKTWQNLKKQPLGDNGTPMAKDYVEGYARVVANSAGAYDDGTPEEPFVFNGTTIPDNRIAYFDVQVETLPSGIQVHPFRLTGIQYVGYKRPDLITPQNDVLNNSGIGTALIAAFNLIKSTRDLLFGFYKAALLDGWCNDLDLTSADSKPSYVRLNTPFPAKVGGGHRVAAVRISDDWTEGSATYGKEYEYTTKDPDGNIISSGVAEYEPLFGGEENALHQPVWYNQNDARVSFRDEESYLEEPFGEALYPSASVGYSRVLVRDLRDENDPVEDDVNKALAGITVHEFYTARDFPVRTEYTDVGSTHFAPPVIPIPLIGSVSYNTHGYSQGYVVHLNDMHGKPRSVSTYPACSEPTGEPKTRTSYVYRTEQDHLDRLSDVANVLSDNFTLTQAKLGTTTEFYVDVDEHSSQGLGVNANINMQGTPFPVPTWLPGFEYSKSMYRAIVTTKVVQKVGIVDRVVNEVDGARSEIANLLFDADTGEPLLTTVNNAWEKPVFTYKYSAHQSYPGMGGAYTNWGAKVALTYNSGAYEVDGVAQASDVFQIGDEVVRRNSTTLNHYWVTDVTGTHIALADASNASISTSPLTVSVARSARRNMQSIINGSIISLNNPVTGMTFRYAVLDAYNEQVSGIQHGDDAEMDGWELCGTNPNFDFAPVSVEIIQNTEQTGIFFDDQTPGCRSTVAFDSFVPTDLADLVFVGFTGTYVECSGYECPQLVFKELSTGLLHLGYWSDEVQNCYDPCIKVLHADATTYVHAHAYDYDDVGLTDGLPGNDYRYGRAGIWRPETNYLYQVDRINPAGEATHIDRNGEYDEFTYFDFTAPGTDAAQRWVPRETMTQYSPFGFALESKDANNLFSAELYGYGNSQVIATGANAEYLELACEGFEDHNGTYAAGHGHLGLVSSAGTLTLGTTGHSGGRSAELPSGTFVGFNTATSSWVPQPGQRYVISAWFKSVNRTDQPVITLVKNGTPYTVGNQVVHDDGNIIDGWRKVDVTFDVPDSFSSFGAHFGFNSIYSGDAFVDDIRVHPADASMSTFVYDPLLYRLIAQLDDRNYATFYNYDEEGVLTQVKKETERGVMTLRTTRQNLAHTP